MTTRQYLDLSPLGVAQWLEDWGAREDWQTWSRGRITDPPFAHLPCRLAVTMLREAEQLLREARTPLRPDLRDRIDIWLKDRVE